MSLSLLSLQARALPERRGNQRKAREKYYREHFTPVARPRSYVSDKYADHKNALIAVPKGARYAEGSLAVLTAM